MTMLYFFSSIYHFCDNGAGEIKCYNECIVDWLSLYILDLSSSAQGMLTPLLHCLPDELRWFREPLFLLNAFIVIITRNTLFSLGMYPWAFSNLLVIIIARAKYQLNGFKTFPLIWWCLTLFFLITGIIFQKAGIQRRYNEIHSIWHICMGISQFCACRFFRKLGIHTKKKNKEKRCDSDSKEKSQIMMT